MCSLPGYNSFILATANIPPNAEDCIKDFVIHWKAYVHRSNKTGVFVVGDLNAKSLLWRDIRCKKSGEMFGMLEQFVEKPEENILMDGEFRFHAATGAFNIDLFFVTDSITKWKFSLYTDTEVELFTGYPN